METNQQQQGDALDATQPDHDPNSTGRVRTTEATYVGEGDERRRLAPGTAMRVPAQEAVSKASENPDLLAPYGQTAEIGDATRAERERRAREGDAQPQQRSGGEGGEQR